MDVAELEPEDTAVIAEDQEDETELEPVEGEGEEEVQILVGDEAAPASGEPETDLVKHLRNVIKEQRKQLKSGDHQEQAPSIGPKPTLEDFDYDEAAYDQAYDAWKESASAVERAEAQRQEEAQRAQQSFEADRSNYEKGKAELGFADIVEAEEVVMEALGLAERAVIIKAASNPALVVYTLAKHPARLKEYSELNDPIKQAAFVARLEGNLKVVTTRKAPAPEKIASGNATPSIGSDKTLERLEREADKTGDRTALIKYRRELRDKSA